MKQVGWCKTAKTATCDITRITRESVTRREHQEVETFVLQLLLDSFPLSTALVES
jgi:hypothetical protein